MAKMEETNRRVFACAEMNDQSEHLIKMMEGQTQMELDNSCTSESPKTWGFRRSTIARREFLEAVAAVDTSAGAPRRSARQAGGKGRGCRKGKQASKTAVISQAAKRGCGSKERIPRNVLKHNDEQKLSTEDNIVFEEAQDRAEGQQSSAVELKTGEKLVSTGNVSDRGEDSDDLTLQEIQERVMARQLEEIKRVNDGVKNAEDTKKGTWLDGSILNAEEVNPKQEKISSTATSGDSTAGTSVQKAVRGRRTKGMKKCSELEKHVRPQMKEEDESFDSSEENSGNMEPDALCCVCQQRHSIRCMICCHSCREWYHVDCVGITESRGGLMEKKGEENICPSCSTKIRETNFSKCEENEEEHKMEEIIMVEEETAAPPKCIGPSCSNDALPGSVYCGHQCIVQHAAVAMKSLSDPKTEKRSPASTESSVKSQKRSFLAKLFKVKLSERPVQEESLAQTEEMESVSLSVTDPVHQPSSAASTVDNKTNKDEVCTLQNQPSGLTLDINSLEETPAAPLIKKSTPGRARKTMPGTPRLEHLRGALSKSPIPALTKPSKSDAVPVPENVSRKPPDVRPTTDEPAMVPASSPLQIRQNIRRSLSEFFLQRLNESDNVNISENGVEKLTANIEKEMFNMCYTTDEDYKNKYQYLMLSLKDPRNEDLFHQVWNGEISPIRLIHLSQQEMKSVKETTGNLVLQMSLKKESPPPCDVIEETSSICQEKIFNTETTESLSLTIAPEEKLSPSHVKQTQVKKITSGVPDMISSMLKDTTSEHRRHLFDLNCRICTGQVSTDGDPETKKPKTEATKNEGEGEKSWVVQMTDEAALHATPSTILDSDVMESPASPTTEDCETQTSSADFSPVLIPSVPVVSITRRDPRTAEYRPSLSLCVDPKFASPPPQQPSPVHSKKMPVQPQLIPVPLPMPKSILMKPSSSSSGLDMDGSTARLMVSHTPSDKGTRQFLSKQDTLWKGFLNMPTVAKFVTKGYLISGSPDFVTEDLPDTIHIGGRILPQTVWEYVELIKTSEAKELSLIRFHPASEEEEVAYVSLFSYFNSRRRFGVVSNICKRIKDLYLIPLIAKESIPAVLSPIDGPGLEQNHPNLLIGLAVCQKSKRPENFSQEVGEKKSSFQSPSDCWETNNATLLNPLKVDAGQDITKVCDPDIPIKTNPCRFLPSIGPPDLPCPVRFPTTPVNTDPFKDFSNTTPLKTILNTLFGQQKKHSESTECEMRFSTDKVQQMCKETMQLCDNDKPYDPEEYDPAMSYGAIVPLSPSEVFQPNIPPEATDDDDDDDDDRPYDPEEEYHAADKGDIVPSNNQSRASEAGYTEESSTANSDVAYDPEDETVFEEMQTYLTSKTKSVICEQENIQSGTTLFEQQKILEELNRQIEEQKRELEEQTENLRLQKEAIGVSMAHFSVSDALMSPPPQFGRDVEESIPNLPAINQNRDPRTCRKTSQDAEVVKDVCQAINKENATQTLSVEQKQTAVLDRVSVKKKEKSGYNEKLSKNGAAETKTLASENTKSFHVFSGYFNKTRDSQVSLMYTNRSTKRRSWHEHRSHHQDRASSRIRHKSKTPADVSNKQHRSRQPAECVSRKSNSDRRKVTSSRTRYHHHHRDTSSPSQCKRRREGKDLKPFVIHNTQSSQPDSDRGSDSDQVLSGAHTSGQSDKLQGKTANYRDEQLGKVQQGDFSYTKQIQRVDFLKHEADKSRQKPKLSQTTGEHSLQPIRNELFDRNQVFSGLSEMKGDNLPHSKIDHSSKQGQTQLSPYMHSSNVVHCNTHQPLNSTPGTHPTLVQTGVFHNNSVSQLFENAPNQPPHNQNAKFLGSEQIDSDLPLLQKQKEFALCKLDQFGHKKYSNHIIKNKLEEKDQNHQKCQQPQLHPSCNFQEPGTDQFHNKKCQPYTQRQNVQRDVSPQFQQRDQSLLGPAPVHKGNVSQGEHRILRTPNPCDHFQVPQPLCFDKWNPLREPPSVAMMELRNPKFSQPRNANPGTFGGSRPFQNFGPRGLDPQPRRQLTESKMFESAGPLQTIGSRGSSLGPHLFNHDMDDHSGSPQVMHDRTHVPLTLPEPAGSPNVGGPHEGHFENRNSQLLQSNSPQGNASHKQVNMEQFDNSEFYMPHLNNPRGYAQSKSFHKGLFHHRDFSQPTNSRGHKPSLDVYEHKSSNCHQTFGEDRTQCRNMTCRPRQDSAPPQNSTCGATHSHFEGQQYPENRGQIREIQQSDFRGQSGRKVGPCSARSPEMNAQIRGPRFDSPQRFMVQNEQSVHFHGQRKPSSPNCDNFEDHNRAHSPFPNHMTTTPPLFKKHTNPCEIKNLRHPRPHFEFPPKQTNTRPLRLSGPLLPTPPGGPIRLSIPSVQKPKLHKESNRPPGPPAIRQGHVTKDINGLWIPGERPSYFNYGFNPQQSDNSESLIQDDQRVGYEDRREEKSVQDSRFGQPCRRPRGRGRPEKRQKCRDGSQDREYAKEITRDLDRRTFHMGRARARGHRLCRNDRSRSHSDWSRSQDLDFDCAVNRHQDADLQNQSRRGGSKQDNTSDGLNKYCVQVQA